MNYQLIYADPPWTYRDKASAGKRGAVHKYPVMTVPEICALNVGSIAAPDCLLAMWWVAPLPEEALAVVRAWGFTLKTVKGFTWHKRTKNGKSHLGMGQQFSLWKMGMGWQRCERACGRSVTGA